MTNQLSINSDHHKFTVKIVLGMFLGIAVGLIVKFLPISVEIKSFFVESVFDTGGQIFFRLIQLLVIPIVLTSIICGSLSLGDFKKLGRVGGKTILLYLFTTAFAITIALIIASSFHIGQNLHLIQTGKFHIKQPESLKEVLINLFPENPFKAIAEGNMLQIIIFALLVGIAIAKVGKDAEIVTKVFNGLNKVMLTLILLIMKTAPYGVFFLLAALFSKIGFTAIGELIGYFFTMLFVLMVQLFVCYPALLFLLTRLNPLTFFRKMYSAMIFAFSISSSSASIPVVLETVEFRLGVHNSVAAFVIPLGATINMDGTAIMQGVATIFIAHAYQLPIGVYGYLTIIAMATLASIGTAGVPGVGMVMLTMVLRQVGLPIEGIALIIGIDRLLDMVRTAVNISGDSMVACIVGKSEKSFSKKVYDDLTL